MVHFPAEVAGPVDLWWLWSWLLSALWGRTLLRNLGGQRSSLGIPSTSARETASLQLEMSLLDTQVHG